MIRIDEEFRALIPPPTDDELRQLEENLKAEGCRDPLVTWDGTILDGHNRYAICSRLSIPFETVAKDFENHSEAVEWIIRNQFGRRNLSDYSRSVLALRLKDTLAARAKENQVKGGGDQKSGLTTLSKPIPPINTRAEIAKAAGVSEGQIAKVEAIEKKAAPEIKEALAKGEISINKAHKTVKEPPPEPEPLVVDGTASKRERVPKWIPDDAERLWLLAKTDLDKILPSDKSRERVLKEVVKYAQNRIDKMI